MGFVIVFMLMFVVSLVMSEAQRRAGIEPQPMTVQTVIDLLPYMVVALLAMAVIGDRIDQYITEKGGDVHARQEERRQEER